MKKNIFITFILSVISFSLCNASITAESIVSNIIRKYETSKSLKADISITSSNGSLKGYIIMQGRCFTINTQDFKTWYNGNTQWSYSSQIGEVNITQPTQDELQTSNPYLAITSYRNKYKGTILRSNKSNEYKVRFTPRSNNCEISEVIFTVNKTSWVINKIIMTTNDGERFTTTIYNAVYGKNFPKSTFQYNRNQVPKNTPLNDLR